MNVDQPDTAYRPIACASYEQYELAILHRHRLHLVWGEDNATFDQVVTPLNLLTRAAQEFLVVRLANGETREVRLDRIRRAASV